jgi:SMI1-KNR4 cell-wall
MSDQAKFSVLAKYIGAGTGVTRFFGVEEEEIVEAEDLLGFPLPSGLKKFYREIGHGWITTEEVRGVRNLIIHPADSVDLFKDDSEFSPPEGFLKGDLPIFDCGSDKFLVTRPGSNAPEAIYRNCGESEPVAEDFKDLISKLLLNRVFYEK